MVMQMNGKTVSIDKDTMTVTESFLLQVTYEINVEDVQKKTAAMSQVESIVKQYEPKKPWVEDEGD